MPEESRFAVYFSHSWRPNDVDLNVRVWEELAADCELLVDEPDEPGANPPYYINRIEELLQRADLFVSVLTHREPRAGDFTGEDANLRCSPYSLFEIRLAQRAGLPHLILYERSTGFRPPRSARPGEAYVPFDRGTRERLPEQRQWTNVIHSKIEQWKDWASRHRRPLSYEQSTLAAMLLAGSPQDPACEVLENALRDSGYEPMRCDATRQRSSEAFRLLREAGLVVVEFTGQDAVFEQLYAAAHGLGLPSIRLLRSQNGQTGLPWILRGDPGGYQNDIVVWNKPEELPDLVKPRMKAMFRLSPARRDGDASDYLQSKRYAQFFVFLSHTLKGAGRELVEEIYSLLLKHHVTPFEYHKVNTAGVDWQQVLKDALQKTTHFVALEDPEYVKSPTCTEELEAVLARGSEVSILPFMIAGQDKPHPRLTKIHNRLVSGESPRADAEVVVQEVMAALDAALSQTVTA
jgi:hypothetical protein